MIIAGEIIGHTEKRPPMLNPIINGFTWQRNNRLPNPKWFFPAVFLMLAIFVLFFCRGVRGEENFSNEQIVNAIFLAEGGSRAQYYYGVRSVKYRDIAEARQICLNSVKNGRKRWIKAGKPYDLIIFIGLRYCPPKAHPKNSAWVRNVKYFLARNVRKGKKETEK